mgnify:CR=1 FL=1
MLDVKLGGAKVKKFNKMSNNKMTNRNKWAKEMEK